MSEPWIVRTLDQVAAFFDRSREAIKDWRRKGMPGRAGAWDLRAILRWRDERLPAVSASPDDPLLGGPASPALERYREERAALARLERLERERTLIPRAAVHDGLASCAGILRRAGDALQRNHGEAAWRILDDAITDFERETDARFGGRDDGSDAE